MLEALAQLEYFLHDDTDQLPTLIKAGLLHVQFGTIHPFLDGNGRLGRLLVTLYLCMQGSSNQPLLYLSLFLKTHRAEYYRLLQAVREEGDWESWLRFFLEGVAETANQAFEAATRITGLFKKDRDRISLTKQRTGSIFRIYDVLQHTPLASPKRLKEETGLSIPTVNVALSELETLGVVAEISGKKRDRIFAYTAYLAILNEGTTPLAP